MNTMKQFTCKLLSDVREQVRSLVNRKTGIGEVDIARLKSLRAKLGITQTDIAELVGIDRSAIAAYETARKNPSPKNRKALAVILDEMERVYEESQR